MLAHVEQSLRHLGYNDFSRINYLATLDASSMDLSKTLETVQRLSSVRCEGFRFKASAKAVTPSFVTPQLDNLKRRRYLQALHVSSVYIEDSLVRLRSASLLNLQDYSPTDPALSDRKYLISELKPKQHNFQL